MHGEQEALERKLFSAARSERATSVVRARSLARALAESRRQPRSPAARIIGVLALAAGVGLVVWLGQGETGPVGIDREALPSVAAEMPPRRASNDTTSTVEPSPKPSAAPTPREPSARRPAASLSEELELLEHARTALANGSAGRALELLRRYEVTLRGTRLRAEATMLRIEALSATGRANEAARLALAFVEENPGSPIADRARSFVTGTDQDPSQEDPGRKTP